MREIPTPNPHPPKRCRRCAGPMFPDVDGDQFCLMCGERVYRWLSAFTDRLMDAMERQALRGGGS